MHQFLRSGVITILIVLKPPPTTIIVIYIINISCIFHTFNLVAALPCNISITHHHIIVFFLELHNPLFFALVPSFSFSICRSQKVWVGHPVTSTSVSRYLWVRLTREGRSQWINYSGQSTDNCRETHTDGPFLVLPYSCKCNDYVETSCS